MLQVINGESATSVRSKLNKDLYDGFTTLTDGAAVTWDTENRKTPQAKLTSTQSFTLTMNNVISGSIGRLKLITNTASAITITFPAGFTNNTLNKALTIYTFAPITGKEYFLHFIVDGTTIEWMIFDAEWKDWVPSFTGFSVLPTAVTARYRAEGNTFEGYISATGGTSNATTMTFTIPVIAANTIVQYANMGIATDNGAQTTGVMRTRVNANIVDCFKSPLTAWTNTAGKGFAGYLRIETT